MLRTETCPNNAENPLDAVLERWGWEGGLKEMDWCRRTEGRAASCTVGGGREQKTENRECPFCFARLDAWCRPSPEGKLGIGRHL